MPKAKYSPCIKVCTHDDEGYCLGCLRTVDEVRGWRNRTEEEQLAPPRHHAAPADLPSQAQSQTVSKLDDRAAVLLRSQTAGVSAEQQCRHA